MPDLKVVCWKWAPPVGYRSAFTHLQVNRLFNMVKRHYHKPFEMVCITDNPRLVDPEVRIIPLAQVEQFAHLPSPHGGVNPACYRRLVMYSDEARELIGERFVSVDLDVVLVDDVTPVWDRPHDFMIWGETLRRTPYNGSMQLMTARRVIEGLPAQVAALARALQPLADHPHVGEIRQRGLMVGIELVRDRASKAEYDYGLRVGHQVCQEARPMGAILRPLGNVVVLMPPLAMTVEELTRLAAIAVAGIERVTARV